MATPPRRALVFVTFVALASASALAQNWTRQYPTTASDLLDVATDGAGTVIAVGNDGVVLRSTDAGLTWTQHSASTGRLAAVELQGNVVLAGGDGLFRSIDGGITFTSTHPVTGVQSIEAVGASNAWAVTSDGFVLRSIDAGASWSLTTLPAGWYFGAHSVSFESPTLGWIGGHNGQMAQTTDGGNTWQLVSSPTNWTLFGIQRDPGPVKFLLEDSGVHRGNAGNWSYTIFPWVTNARDFDIEGSFGLAVGLSGRIMYSPNNGVNWLFVHDDGPNEHEGVVILDALTAVVVGEDGRILRTDDGGTGWTVVRGGAGTSSPWVRGLAASDADTLFAACTDGIVLRTDDAGANWTELQAGTANTHLRAVDSFDGVNIIAVGERQGFYPTICFSNDGGLNWNEHNALGMYDYYDVAALGATTAVAVSETFIWRTTNGGTSWTSTTPLPYTDFHALDFVDANTGWATGTGFFKTQDGGLSWTYLGDAQHRMWGISFVDANVGWAVGDAGTILHTTNGGSTWNAQSSGVTSVLRSVHAVTPMVAMAVGYDGQVLWTTNGGSSWSPNAPAALSSDPLHAVVATTRGLWIGGDADAGIWRLSSSTSSCVVEAYCTGKVHSLGGVANMAVFGVPSIGLGIVGVGVMGAIPSTLGIGFRSDTGPASLPLWNGTLCVLGPLTRLPVMAFDGNGFGYYSIPMSPPMVGTSQWYQVIFRDVNATDGTGIGMTNGMRLTFCP
jgi:photosystem II stability/assembly factor-like uncharacterized protein